MARTHQHSATSTSDLSACMATGHTRKHRHSARTTPLTGYTPSTRTHTMSHVSHHTPTHSKKKYTAQSSSAWGQQHLR